MSNLYIPTKIKVGFQNRTDTFTGKLAFITFFDEDGNVKQEKSWNGWRDHKIEVLEFDNIPHKGFVLNKGVQRNGHWGSGRSVIRVHDERGFEFEITVDNLIGILMHSDVSKRDIMEECIFAWSGRSLILLPTNSDDYQEALKYTKKQGENVKDEDLVQGKTYHLKDGEKTVTYLGKMDWYDWKSPGYNIEHYKKINDHIFYSEDKFFLMKVEKISSQVSDEIDEKFSERMDGFFKTINSQKIINIKIKEIKEIEKLSKIYKYKDNKITSFSFYDYDYYNENKNIYNIERSSCIVEYLISLRSSLKQKYIQESRKSDIPLEIIEEIEKKGLLIKGVPKLQYKEIIKKLGYGNLVYVLENNYEIEE